MNGHGMPRKLKRAIRKLDVETVYKMRPDAAAVVSSPKAALAGLHKIRAEAQFCTEAERNESRAWLMANGMRLLSEWAEGRSDD